MPALYIHDEFNYVKPKDTLSLFDWRTHKRVFGVCSDCELCQTGGNGKGVYTCVLFRGRVPCNVLFIGEAPGDAENMTGLPFINPHTSAPIIRRLTEQVEVHDLTWGITNMVACQPPGNRVPSKDEMKACHPRLSNLIEITRPRLIVLMGKTARENFDPDPFPSINVTCMIKHPVAVCRRQTQLEQDGDLLDMTRIIDNAIAELD